MKDYKEITLTGQHSDKVVKVSPQDYQAMIQYSWHRHPRGYAHCWYPHPDGEVRKTLMHRVILGIIDQPEVVADHINGDPLDNRRENLRAVTQQDNQQNRKDRYKCVKYSEKLRGWISSPSIKGTTYLLGPYGSKNAAISATSNLRLEKVDNPAPADIQNSNPEVLIKYVTDYRAQQKLQKEFEKSLEKAIYDERKREWVQAAKEQREKDRIQQRSRVMHKSRHRGLVWDYRAQKWSAYYQTSSGERTELGLYDTEEEALEVRAAHKATVVKTRPGAQKDTRKCQRCKKSKDKSEYGVTSAGNPSYACNECMTRARVGYRTCNTCKVKLEYTEDNFGLTKSGKLSSVCVQCKGKRTTTPAPTGPKTCKICKVSYPRTTEYFYKRSDAKDGFRSECKQCKINKTLADKANRENI